MLQNRISGLPVLDKEGELVGMVTEGDFLRRGELGTQRRRPKWLEFILGPGKLAQEYVHSSGRKVEEIMTTDPRTISETIRYRPSSRRWSAIASSGFLSLATDRMVGIVSRANLMHALASLTRDINLSAPTGGDLAIRTNILTTIEKLDWAPHINVIVKDSVVELWGVITDDRERQGHIVAAENVTSVKQVHDHLVWVEPMSGMAFPSTEDEAEGRKRGEGS